MISNKFIMKNNKASIFVYILLLINIIFILGIIIFNNSYILRNNLNFGVNAKESFANVYNKGKIALDSVRLYNSNGNGFVDGISCPQNITMSGTTNSGSNLVSNIIYDNGIIYCSGDYSGDEFRIYFDDDLSDFSKVVFNGKAIGIIKSIYTILRILLEASTVTSATATSSSVGHNVEMSVDGNDTTYYESKNTTSAFVQYVYVPSISIGKIILKKPAHTGSASGYWNNGRITLYDDSGTEITYILLSNIKDQGELIFDMKYLGLENKVKTIKITAEYGKIDISEFEVYELVSDGVEELWEGDMDFNDLDLTKINFDFIGIGGGDNIDDDYNSDNYRVTSIGDIYYPNGYQDDDVIPRKIIFGSVESNNIYENIFWTNQKTNEFIDKNTNNNDILNMKASDAENAYVYLDLYNDSDNLFDIKILEFDRDTYNNEFSLYPIKSSNGKNLTDFNGYIQEDNGVLSLSNNITGNEYIFDLKNKDYGIFLMNKSNGNLVYRLSAQSNTGTGIYINPIDDSLIGEMEILSNYITIGGEKNFIGESFIITDVK